MEELKDYSRASQSEIVVEGGVRRNRIMQATKGNLLIKQIIKLNDIRIGITFPSSCNAE